MSLEMAIEWNDHYVEITWAGMVPEILPMPSPYDGFPDGSKVLVNATGLTGASRPVWRWAGVAAAAAARGLKVAVVSPPGLIFGLFRQALLTAGVDQEHAIALFQLREHALTWLMSNAPASRVRETAD